MDKHQSILDEVVRGVIGFDPVCSILVVGSVGRGDYRPDSDIDMIVVSWRCNDMSTVRDAFLQVPDKVDWPTPCRHAFVDDDGDPGWSVDGVPVHMLSYSPLDHQATIMERPIWRLGKKRILHDPSGIGTWGERCAQQFERDNPTVCAEVNEFVRAYQRFKKGEAVTRRFERLEDFMATIDLSQAVFRYESFANEFLERTREGSLGLQASID